MFNDYLTRFDKDNQAELNLTETDNGNINEDVFEFNKCETCNRIFVNKFQWQCK